MGLSETAHGWWAKRSPSQNLSKHPTMMKLGRVMSYLKNIKKKNINHMIHFLSSANISIFSLEISIFSYIKKYGYRWYFDTQFLILST